MNNCLKKVLLLVVALFLLFTLASCENNKKISIGIQGDTSVFVGGSITLEAVVKNSNEEVEWSSSDETIATVAGGVVTGIKKGEVVIKASIGEISGEINLTVKEREIMRDNLFCGVNLITEEVLNHKKVEFALVERNPGYIKANYNPFDYSKIKVYAAFTSPDGKENITAIAFWYREYTLILDTSISTSDWVLDGEVNGKELAQASGDYEYRIRFQPSMAGVWQYKIYVEVEDGIFEELSDEVEVKETEEEYKGYIRIDKSNNHTFIYDDGTTFMPIGENMGWWSNDSRKTYDYYYWFLNANKNNMNIARIWMAPWGFCLHWGKSIYDLSDRLNYAARLDKVLDYADQFDMYIMLTLLNHGQFSAQTDPKWNENPYNKANGGILTKPEDFFKNKEAKDVYKNELLYIIGRYGYSDNIMCWELFNEVDWTDSASLNSLNIKNWHKEMGEFIRMNDSYEHLITTSYKTEQGSSFTLDIIDFVCPHSYGYAGKNICDTLPEVLDRLYDQYNKPVLHAEIGIDWQNGQNNYRLDPKGINLRQNSWAGMMGGGAGGAMNWWWDSYVHPYNLYYQFAGAGAYAKLMDLTGSDYTELRTLSGVEKSDGVGLLGYRFDNRIYGYVYDVNWRYSIETGELTGITVNIPFTDGAYTLTIYNATTGNVIDTKNVTVSGGKVEINLPAFTSDIAFIVSKGE